jgi:hypothetical protein
MGKPKAQTYRCRYSHVTVSRHITHLRSHGVLDSDDAQEGQVPDDGLLVLPVGLRADVNLPKEVQDVQAKAKFGTTLK